MDSGPEEDEYNTEQNCVPLYIRLSGWGGPSKPKTLPAASEARLAFYQAHPASSLALPVLFQVLPSSSEALSASSQAL